MTIHYDLCNNIYIYIVPTRQAHFCCLRRFCYNNMYHTELSRCNMERSNRMRNIIRYNIHYAPV